MMTSSRNVNSRIHIPHVFYLILLFIFPSTNHASNKEVIDQAEIEYSSQHSDNNATIIFDGLEYINYDNTEIRYGYPDSRYHQLSVIRGGSIGNTHIIKAPVGSRIVLSYSPNMALRCLYFDITDQGESKVKFNESFGHYTTFRINNTKTLKPMFKSEYDHIISDNYYHCSWPTP